MRKDYILPTITVISIAGEGVLCASDHDQMILPDVNWKDETEW